MTRAATLPGSAGGSSRSSSRGARSDGERAGDAGDAGRAGGGGLGGYFRRAELPLSSLAFLLPMIVIYELGTRYVLADPTSHGAAAVGGQRIIAFTMMQQFFNFFGATGHYLPALAVTGILLTWHIARRDPWHVEPSTLIGMTIESLLLAIPLMAMGYAAARYLPMAAPTHAPPAYAPPPMSSRGMLVLSIGAGVYEELIFRLAAFTALSLLFIDILKFPRFGSYLLIVAISSVGFAAYHYLGAEVFNWRTFVFRSVAGAYFGAIFALRGFGLSAGCHTAYDVLIVFLRVFAGH
jgi:hypothetical protein